MKLALLPLAFPMLQQHVSTTVSSAAAKMEKRADTVDISVLFFLAVLVFLAVYTQSNYKHCA